MQKGTGQHNRRSPLIPGNVLLDPITGQPLRDPITGQYLTAP